ncbi:MAG: hypothetical protein Q8906_09475 [Bacillota bacterium]|nr:hypothetical protein [Bacillota bacterium]
MDNSEEFIVIQLHRPAPRGRFGPDDEVKERLHRQALQRLSGLNRALTPFVLGVLDLYELEVRECLLKRII